MKPLKKLTLFLCAVGLHVFPADAQTSSFYIDGLEWHCEVNDSIEVCATYDVVTMHDLNYYQFNIVITNLKSSKAVSFGEDYNAYVSKKGKMKELKVWDAGEFNKRMKSLDMLTEGLEGFNAGMGKGKATSFERQFNNMVIEYNSALRGARRSIVNAGYLKRNTISPGGCVAGYVMSERKKGDVLELFLEVSGRTFNFSWEI